MQQYSPDFRFSSIEDVIAELNLYFAEFDKSFNTED